MEETKSNKENKEISKTQKARDRPSKKTTSLSPNHLLNQEYYITQEREEGTLSLESVFFAVGKFLSWFQQAHIW